MGSRLAGLGAAAFGLVQVLGGFVGPRADSSESLLLTLFYAAAWVCGLHWLFGTESGQRTRS